MISTFIKRTLFLGILMTGIPGICQQSGYQDLDLKQCLKMALDQHIKIKNGEIDLQKAAAQLKQVEAGFYPQAKVGATYQDFIQLPTQLIPGEFFGQPGEMIPIQFGTQHNLSTSVDVSQVLFSQPLLIGRQQARKALELSMLSNDKFREEVIYETAQVFFAAQGLQSQVSTWEQNVGTMQKLTDLMQQQYDLGYIRKVDLDRVKVNTGNLQSQLDVFRDGYDQQLIILKYLTGIPSETPVHLNDSIEPSILPNDLAWSPSGLNEYKQCQALEDLATGKIREAKASGYPTLAAIGQYSLQSQQNEFSYLYQQPGWLKMSFVGISLNVPLFQGFAKQHAISQAGLEQQQAVLQKENTARLLEVQYRSAVSKLEVSRKTTENQLSNKKLAEEVYQVTLDQYKEGISPLSDILDAESSLRSAQSALLQSQVQMKLSEIDLMKSTGNLNLLIQ